MEITCPRCQAVFADIENMDRCPWCLCEIKRSSRVPKRHFVQYHKTDEYGPPASRAGAFGIDTNKPVDNAFGATAWLISGEGTPKQYFLDCFFVVDRVSVHDDPDSEFRNCALGTKGRKLQPRIQLNAYDWFQNLRVSLADFGAGFSEIGTGTAAKLEMLVEASGLPTGSTKKKRP